MKKLKTNLILLSFSFLLFALTMNAQTQTQPKVLRHVVLFKFKDTSKEDDIKKVEDAFRVIY
jgi:hypothetical protein